MIQAEAITLSYQHRQVIHNITTSIPTHQITVLIGANGCGKSTLLKSFAKILLPQSGAIELESQPITDIPHKKFAQKVALLSQNLHTTEDISIEQLVRYGRYPHHRLFSSWQAEDDHFVEEALSLTHLTALRNQSLQSLSGGQRQRAWIAMTLAQNTPYILLDEPTTYLDLAHQIEILSLLQKLNQTMQKTIIMVLHDLNLAARYADHLIAIKDGQIYQSGTAEMVITETHVQAIFGLKSKIIKDPIHQTPLCIPL